MKQWKTAYLEHISRHVLGVFDFEGDLSAFLGNSSTRFDFVISITTSVTVGSHNDDVLPSQRTPLTRTTANVPGNKGC
jgi:hypothetical protein